MMSDMELSAARIIVLGALRAGRLSAAQIAEYLRIPLAIVERISCELDVHPSMTEAAGQPPRRLARA